MRGKRAPTHYTWWSAQWRCGYRRTAGPGDCEWIRGHLPQRKIGVSLLSSRERSPKMIGRGLLTSVHATWHVPRSVVDAARGGEGMQCAWTVARRAGLEWVFLASALLVMSILPRYVPVWYGDLRGEDRRQAIINQL